MIFARIFVVKDMIHMSGWAYVNNVLAKALYVTIISLILPLIIRLLQPMSIWRLIEICIVCFLCTPSAIFFVGMNKEEQRYIIEMLKKKFVKKHVG